MIKASKYAYDLTKEFNYPKEDALMEGVIKLYENDRADRLIEKIISLGLERADFKYLSKNLIKKKYGINNKAGIFFKNGGWVSPNKICSSLINHKNIKLIPKKKAKEITYKKSLWITSCHDLSKYAASNVILLGLMRSAYLKILI